MSASPPDRLERRYRRWLLAYPAEYRRERGDELAATLLDLADPERTRPAFPEVVAILRSAAGQRMQQLARRCRAPWLPRRRGRTVLILGFVWTCIISVSLLIAPMTLGFACVEQVTAVGVSSECGPQVGSLLSEHGVYGYLWLLPPWELAMLAALVRRRWMPAAAAAALTSFIVLDAGALGTYYLPTLLACWLGALWVKDPGMPDVVGATGIPGTSPD